MKKLEEDVLLLEDQNSKFVKVKERQKAIIEREKTLHLQWNYIEEKYIYIVDIKKDLKWPNQELLF